MDFSNEVVDVGTDPIDLLRRRPVFSPALSSPRAPNAVWRSASSSLDSIKEWEDSIESDRGRLLIEETSTLVETVSDTGEGDDEPRSLLPRDAMSAESFEEASSGGWSLSWKVTRASVRAPPGVTVFASVSRGGGGGIFGIYGDTVMLS